MKTASYDALVKSGAIGTFKRDVVLEASRDLEYLETVLWWFAEKAGRVPEAEQIPNTVQLIEELIAAGVCRLATWKNRGREPFDSTADEIAALLSANSPMTYFLIATEKGDQWVRKYDALVAELGPRSK